MKKQNSSKVNTTITETAAVVKSTTREQLKNLSNSLMELAQAAGRTDARINELLRETYQLVGQELKTFEAWQAEGANIRRGQHAYLFWGAPVESKNGFSYCPVQYLFTREQVHMAH